MSSNNRAGILVVAEQVDGRINPVSFEAVAFGLELGGIIGKGVNGVVLGHPARLPAVELAEGAGISVISADHENLARYNAEAYISAMAGIIEEKKPDYLVVPHTTTGWDFAPRLATAVSGSCSTGVTGIKMEDGPAFERHICSGKVINEVAPERGRLSVLTVMPGFIKPGHAGGSGSVQEIEVEASVGSTRTLGREKIGKGGLDLSSAEVIVAAGRGAASEEGLRLVAKLSNCFDKGAVGASRGLVEAGWLPLEHQVGQTGQTVAPRLYIACGISGAIQHIMAMAGSGLVVAINTDPKAPIFQVAQIGVVKDLYEFLPVLIDTIVTRGKI